MADKTSDKRSGGDRPMRRRPSSSDAPGRKAARAPSGKPKAEEREDRKSAKPRATKRAKPAPAPIEKTSAFAGERIAKAMARAGVCSRRDAEDWIKEGRVAVNGVRLTTPAVNVVESDRIEIDGAPMQARERTRLFLFHKPQGYVTTAHDPEGRPTVFSFLEERHPDLPRLVSVGRLDMNTEGLLLLTNDGGLARTLELPATGWTRRYRVRVHGEVDQARLDALRQGVVVEDVTYAPIEARLERVQGTNAWIALALTEGKNREVKRVMEHLGLDVTRLIRISYGPFQLGELAEGAVEEVKLKVLRDQLGKSLAEFAGVDFASPLREATPAEEQEQRERTEKRSRKHVSVLRKQRDERTDQGPRMRIERGATADRKGRAVVVERVAPTARKRVTEEAGASRNARRFEAMRGSRPPRRDAEETEAPRRGARAERSARPEGAGDKRRPPRFEGDRPERPQQAAERRAHGDVKAARDHARTRPQGGEERRYERRPPRQEGGEGHREGRQKREFGSAETRAPRPPRQGREMGGRERFERPSGGQTARNARGGDRPARARAGEAGKPERDQRAPRKGPPKGPLKGPPKGRGGAGAGSGAPRRGPPRKGPAGKGPAGKGPGAGPRKPRGA